MIHAIAVIVGLCLGVLQAEARVPTARRLSTVSTMVLAIVFTLSLLWVAPGSLLDATLFVVSGLVSSVLTAGYLWRKTGPDESVNY